MDLVNVIIGAIFVAICIVPFILVSLSRKNREKQILQSLSNIASKHNCKINQSEICGDFIIGIDETKKIVFFLKKMKDTVIEQFIDLADIQNCKINNTTRTVITNDNNYNLIEKLELSFIPISKNKTGIILEFFNTDFASQLCGELQTVEKWNKLINDHLKTK